ncbi:MAG: hypothetical protein K9J27_05445 [Bacteroidales bacterium]|nr:hypothetical protein [Bacteroidales bacterium]MCF8333364.1 hypothetical protein [Bacteroidales bacterium]
MAAFEQLFDFLKIVSISTLSQLIGIFGVFFAAGLVLYLLARFTRNAFARAGARQLDILLTGWIGTPVHELGHAFFCLVFFHRIEAIRLFRPNSADGSLGYVQHSYSHSSYYQKIGNLFIGAGPIIFGAIVLYTIMYYLLPNQHTPMAVISSSNLQMSNILNLGDKWDAVYRSGYAMVQAIFTHENLTFLSFWVFLYASLAVASHMELSPSDIKGMWSGLLTLIVLLLLVNFVTLLFGLDISKYVFMVNRYTGMFFGLFVYAIVISAINFILSYVLLTLYTLIRYRRLFNPIF